MSDLLRPVQGLKGIPVGTLVLDTATGCVGVLQDVRPLPDMSSFPPTRGAHVFAFLRPVGGGPEWVTEPELVERA